ncbi:MAG TPA: hypothetical protein VEO74_06685 [Thermoanaerobaculia bacterium]|nr:hypothetical protein [Thermoanaerobaculia bacterium]
MRRRSVFFTAAFFIATAVTGQTPTPGDLSKTLNGQCDDWQKIDVLVLTEKDIAADKCAAAKEPAEQKEIDACREILQAVFSKQLDDKIATHESALLEPVKKDTAIVQRLHPVLAARKTALKNAMTDALKKAVADLKLDTGSAKLRDRVILGLGTINTSVRNAVHSACIQNDATVIDTVAPKPTTASEAAAMNKQIAEQTVAEAERQAFAQFSKSEGFTHSVDCIWAKVTANGEPQAKITCKPGLLVSGEQVSEIRIHGMPAGPVQVTAMSSEQFTQGVECGTDDLACDTLLFPRVVPNPIVIAVHTARALFPTWGTTFGGMGGAHAVLRPGKPRNKLSLITNGTAPTISVSVISGGLEASTWIPVGFARWKIESGGFLAVSKLVDNEVVTVPGSAAGQVHVTGIRRADNLAQDSGIFATFIPQNYQSIGVTFGIATPSGRRPSFYLGPGLRVRTFGDKGLASLSFGLAMRSVQRFPDVKVDTSANVPADSAALKGKEQLGIHWFVAINLGFRIGSFGPGETEK